MTRAQLQAWRRRRRARRERAELGAAVPAWLQTFPWTHMATFTFRPPRNGQTVRNRHAFCKRHLERFLREVSRLHFGRRWKKHGLGVAGVIAWEKHVSGAWHAHMLILGAPEGRLDYLRIYALADLDQVIGQRNIIGVRDAEAVKYVAKYVAKGRGQFDIFNAERLQQFVGSGPSDLAFDNDRSMDSGGKAFGAPVVARRA